MTWKSNYKKMFGFSKKILSGPPVWEQHPQMEDVVSAPMLAPIWEAPVEML
jgi:hypothetical protein